MCWDTAGCVIFSFSDALVKFMHWQTARNVSILKIKHVLLPLSLRLPAKIRQQCRSTHSQYENMKPL